MGRCAKYHCLEGIQVGKQGSVRDSTALGQAEKGSNLFFSPPGVKTVQLFLQRGKYEMWGSSMVSRRTVMACGVQEEARSDVLCSNNRI